MIVMSAGCGVKCSAVVTLEFVRLSIAFVNVYIYLTVLGFDWRFSEFKEMNEILTCLNFLNISG